MAKLDSKTALITGSDSGMGQAMAEEFARAGANVAITFHTDEAGAEESRRRVQAAGRKALVGQTDIRDEGSVGRLFEAVSSELGTPDILVNDAGVGSSGANVAEMTTDEFNLVIKPISAARSSAAGSSFVAAKRMAVAARSSISPRCTKRFRAPTMRRMARRREGC
jgi:NAD(P)-dependent dehydrogenase (short-subunit alcohol dehydrogenase family)